MKNYIKTIFTLLCLLSPVQQALADSHWTCNVNDYKNDMSLYFSPVVDDTQLTSLDGYEIAAFVGDECRGIAEMDSHTYNSVEYKYGYLRIRSNQTTGETVNFKLYRKSDNQEVTSSNSLTFDATTVVGQPSSPQSITFNCKYTITFDSDGGSEISPITQEYNSTIVKPDDPVKTGYTFNGWDKDIPSTMPAENVTIKAKWSINSYKLTYLVDGETYKEYTLEYGSSITPEAAPEKEGNVFSGWSDIPATMPAHEVTVTGSFSAGKYTLTYYVDGEVYKTFGYDYGATVTPLAAPTKEGYSFSGWDDEPATMPAENKSVYGTFTVIKYTVRFVVNGNIVKEETLDYGSKITVPEDPTKEGYTFTGWSPEVDVTVPAKDVTYTAQFSVNSYKLTYTVDGAMYKEITLQYGTAISSEAAPEKEGYSFSGWSEIPETMPAHNVEITGSFTINSYKLTYIVDNEPYKEYTLKYGASISPEPAPIKSGYTFSGWSDIPKTMPAHNVEVTGSFSASFTLGDVNNDTKIDVTDIAYLVAFLNDKIPVDFIESAADVDGNGVVNVDDVTALGKLVIKKQ